MRLKVFHPGIEASEQDSTASTQAGRQPVAAPLKGALRLALLDNTKVNSIELMDAVAMRLGERIQVEVRRWRKRHAGESGATAIAELAAWKPHLVLTGLGD